MLLTIFVVIYRLVCLQSLTNFKMGKIDLFSEVQRRSGKQFSVELQVCSTHPQGSQVRSLKNTQWDINVLLTLLSCNNFKEYLLKSQGFNWTFHWIGPFLPFTFLFNFDHRFCKNFLVQWFWRIWTFFYPPSNRVGKNMKGRKEGKKERSNSMKYWIEAMRL